MKSGYFTNIVANVVLVVLVLSIAGVAFSGATTNVFNKNDMSPIYRGGNSKQVTLMVNVYWGTEYIKPMLEILDKYNVKTTFFVGGFWVAQYPEILKQIDSFGHEVGNHGYYHKQHSKLTYQQNVTEIVSCAKLIYEYIGKMPMLFAPPSGDFSNDTLNAVYDNGHRTIMWSRDTIDWRDKDAQLVYQRATKDTSGGELILMHPTKHTLQALEKIVTYYLNNGYKIVPVSQNIASLYTKA